VEPRERPLGDWEELRLRLRETSSQSHSFTSLETSTLRVYAQYLVTLVRDSSRHSATVGIVRPGRKNLIMHLGGRARLGPVAELAPRGDAPRHGCFRKADGRLRQMRSNDDGFVVRARALHAITGPSRSCCARLLPWVHGIASKRASGFVRCTAR
jgi:hypothetical protein